MELGAVTMRQLGLHLGDQVRIWPDTHLFTVVGTVTLPSMGVSQTEHVSLGSGAMMEESALEAVQELATKQSSLNTAYQNNAGDPGIPSAVAIDVSSAADASRLAARIIKAEPDKTPGGMYELPPQQAAQIINFRQMGALPLALALGVAAAAIVALALTVTGLGPRAPPRARAAEVPGHAARSAQGHRHESGHHHPGGRDTGRSATRSRGRPVGMDHLRELDRGSPGSGSPGHPACPRHRRAHRRRGAARPLASHDSRQNRPGRPAEG